MPIDVVKCLINLYRYLKYSMTIYLVGVQFFVAICFGYVAVKFKHCVCMKSMTMHFCTVETCCASMPLAMCYARLDTGTFLFTYFMVLRLFFALLVLMHFDFRKLGLLLISI